MPDDKLKAEVEALAREFAARITALVARSLADEVSAALARHVAPRPAGGDEPEPRAAGARGPRGPGGRGRRRVAGARPPVAVERWVPDRRARRVPNFVIELTGLRTKKEIVDRFGEHAIFEKGQPSPPPLRAARGEAAAE